MSIKLMSHVWDKTAFRGTELLVLLCLADHANDDGICWPAYDRIAQRARCSRRQAIRCVESLIAEGWLIREGRKPVGNGGYVNIFRVIQGGDIITPPKRGDISKQRGDKNSINGVSPMSPESSLNRKIEPPLRSSRCAEEDSEEPFDLSI